MCEIPPETVRRAYVVVDDLDAAGAEAGDLIQADRPAVCTIGDVLAGRHPQVGEDVTMFKSVGIASQDVLRHRPRMGQVSAVGPPSRLHIHEQFLARELSTQGADLRAKRNNLERLCRLPLGFGRKQSGRGAVLTARLLPSLGVLAKGVVAGIFL